MVEPIVAVPMLMITAMRMPCEDDRQGERQLDIGEHAQARKAEAFGRVLHVARDGGEPGDRVFRDRQRRIDRERHERRGAAIAEKRHRDREHRDRREGLADRGDRIDQRRELERRFGASRKCRPRRRRWWPPRSKRGRGRDARARARRSSRAHRPAARPAGKSQCIGPKRCGSASTSATRTAARAQVSGDNPEARRIALTDGRGRRGG